MKSNAEILRASGAENQARFYEDYYASDPLFGYNRSLQQAEMFLLPPPVERLVCIHGVSLDTEVFTAFAPLDPAKKNSSVSLLDVDASLTPAQIDTPSRFAFSYENSSDWDRQYDVLDGVALETPNTRQRIFDLLYGVEGRGSGDGTVPYASLSFCRFWQQLRMRHDLRAAAGEAGPGDLEGPADLGWPSPPAGWALPAVDVHELHGAPHREILEDPRLLGLVLDVACSPCPSGFSSGRFRSGPDGSQRAVLGFVPVQQPRPGALEEMGAFPFFFDLPPSVLAAGPSSFAAAAVAGPGMAQELGAASAFPAAQPAASVSPSFSAFGGQGLSPSAVSAPSGGGRGLRDFPGGLPSSQAQAQAQPQAQPQSSSPRRPEEENAEGGLEGLDLRRVEGRLARPHRPQKSRPAGPELPWDAPVAGLYAPFPPSPSGKQNPP
jgi:hypothetical protein